MAYTTNFYRDVFFLVSSVNVNNIMTLKWANSLKLSFHRHLLVNPFSVKWWNNKCCERIFVKLYLSCSFPQLMFKHAEKKIKVTVAQKITINIYAFYQRCILDLCEYVTGNGGRSDVARDWDVCILSFILKQSLQLFNGFAVWSNLWSTWNGGVGNWSLAL